MSWSYKKSIGAGPLKLNFSKSGISYSFGVKGARVNTGPKGTFVSLSAHGITYRKKISVPAPALSPVPATEEVHTIASAGIDQLTDTDSKTFITELNKKSGKASYVKVFGIVPLAIVLFILIFILPRHYIWYELMGCLSCFIPLMLWLKKADKKRFEMELNYDMDDKYKQVYQQFSYYFESFSRSSRSWQYLNLKSTSDHKRNAGAAQLVKRVPVRMVLKNKMPIPYFITNVPIPYISLSNMELFFLPERLLIKRANTFAAIFYKHLQVAHQTNRFIESDVLPKDAEVVDYTWQYVNKNGGPDRRFNNNRKLPVCLYSEYTFTSDTGFFELISTSKMGAMDGFAAFLLKIGELQREADLS